MSITVNNQLGAKQAYQIYLQTPTWHERRWKVIERAKGICEGCGNRKATQIHHLRYPKNVLPGTERWIYSEKLYDLVALCERCHRDVHHDFEPE